MWNLERWYWWTYLQGSNGNTDIQNRLMDTGREGEGGKNWESSTETYALPCVKLLGWCKSNLGFTLLNFAIWYWNTFLNKCGYVTLKKLTCISTEKKSKEIKYNNMLMPIKSWVVSPEKIYWDPNARYLECDLIWKQGLCRFMALRWYHTDEP